MRDMINRICTGLVYGVIATGSAQAAPDIAQQFTSPTLALSDAQGRPYYPQDTHVYAREFLDQHSFVIAPHAPPQNRTAATRAHTVGVTRSQPIRTGAFPTHNPASTFRSTPVSSSNIMDPWSVGVFR